jgi:hypothetical protein
MDISRAERIADIVKTTSQLGKNIKKVSSPLKMPTILGQAALPQPVEGTGILKILMYVVAGLLLIGLILLTVDQWITPIFQRTPGGRGYIPIPGTDLSQVYWQTGSTVDNIIIGTPAPPIVTPGAPVVPPLSTTVLEGQSNYSITMDVFIKDESPQVLDEQDRRVFFMLGQSVATPTLTVWIANDKNTAYVTTFDRNGMQESAAIDNVPIHAPFRIGIVNTPYALEAYLNGKLVMTRQKRSINKMPTTGDIIFSPANIIVGGKVLSQNIKVLNVRTFGYSVSTSEMRGRMGDLTSATTFNPPSK